MCGCAGVRERSPQPLQTVCTQQELLVGPDTVAAPRSLGLLELFYWREVLEGARRALQRCASSRSSRFAATLARTIYATTTSQCSGDFQAMRLAEEQIIGGLVLVAACHSHQDAKSCEGARPTLPVSWLR